MTLSIGIVGPLLIESADYRLGKLPKKARALLAYLAAEGGRPVSRERLADLLWPYQSSEQARHSLRNCLLELRKAFGSAAALHLVADFANCCIRNVGVDLDRFETLARSDHPDELQSAADLYRGEFLADFHITSEPFQEWLAAERDRTLALVCEVLQRLTAARDSSGEHEAAIRSGRRLVALDPLSEHGQRALMRSYANAGRRGEALRQYKICAENLKRELGVPPDHETQALASEVTQTGAAADVSGIPDRAHAQSYVSSGALPGFPAEERLGAKRPEAPASRQASPLWPCLLPSVTVAVAPLRNLTGNSDQQYLVEAFTDDLVTDLMRHGRTLSLKPLEQDQIADSPSGRMPKAARAYDYVVTGSAQRSNAGTLRVNMRIVDAATSEYLWAGRHEFRPEDLALIQTRITRRISRELHVLLLQAASRRALAASGMEVDVADCLSRATAALEKGVRPEFSAEAQRWYLAALANDPRNVEALTGLAQTCQYLVSNPWWSDPRVAVAASDLGREAAAIALSVAPGHAEAHCIQGMLYSAAGQLEEAARAFNRAVTMDQGLGIAHGFAGYNAAFLGRADETLPAVERAMRLDPTDRRHSIWFFFGGFAELLRGRTEEAITLLDKSLARNPSYGSAQLFMAAALSMNGQRTQASERATAFRARYPDYRTNAFEQLWLSRSSSAAYRAQIHPLFEKVCALGVAN
jgi:DNA-binding SARP family transcriptional activator/TolB-like protein/tetratricopeptide (TPR) repeat protein